MRDAEQLPFHLALAIRDGCAELFLNALMMVPESVP
jgi:hypothetical protein